MSTKRDREEVGDSIIDRTISDFRNIKQTKETIILKISLIQGSQDEVVQLTKQIRNCISFLSSGCTTKFIKYP